MAIAPRNKHSTKANDETTCICLDVERDLIFQNNERDL